MIALPSVVALSIIVILLKNNRGIILCSVLHRAYDVDTYIHRLVGRLSRFCTLVLLLFLLLIFSEEVGRIFAPVQKKLQCIEKCTCADYKKKSSKKMH